MVKRRIGVARFWHESNGFSSALTQIGDFEDYQGGTLVGDAIFEGTDRGDEIAGFTDVLRQRDDVEIVPLISAGALPSGLISAEAAAHLESLWRTQLEVAAPLDGVCIAPHGAMVAEGIDDFDGHLLAVLRDHLPPDAVVATALDCHAVVTEKMIAASTAVVAYRTHPHRDVVETGRRGARILLDALEGRTRPVVRSTHLPMIMAPPDDGTVTGVMKELFDACEAWDERPGTISCAVCPAFAWQDVPGQGVSTIGVTDGDPALAQRIADELAEQTWEARQHFRADPMCTVPEAMRQASRLAGNPIVITDSADTVGGGAPGDNSVLLSHLLEHRALIDGLILTHLPDAPAIAELADACVGDVVTLAVGGKRDTRFCQPLTITGRVACITAGPIEDDFGAGTTPTTETGPIVCLAIDNVRLVLTERTIHGPQTSLYRKVGIEPFDAKVVALKTGIGFKKAYAKVAAAVYRADCPGAESYDLSRYSFRNLRRPIWPLDENTRWQKG